MAETLTKKQEEILRYLKRFMWTNGYPPSVRDIAGEFKIASPNGVMCHLKALEKKGKIKRDENVSRGIVILLGKGNVCPYCRK